MLVNKQALKYGVQPLTSAQANINLHPHYIIWRQLIQKLKWKKAAFITIPLYPQHAS